MVGPTDGFVTGLFVCLLLLRISRFKELRLSKVSNASSVSPQELEVGARSAPML